MAWTYERKYLKETLTLVIIIVSSGTKGPTFLTTRVDDLTWNYDKNTS